MTRGANIGSRTHRYLTRGWSDAHGNGQHGQALVEYATRREHRRVAMREVHSFGTREHSDAVLGLEGIAEAGDVTARLSSIVGHRHVLVPERRSAPSARR
jgi:hypothetical protein